MNIFVHFSQRVNCRPQYLHKLWVYLHGGQLISRLPSRPLAGYALQTTAPVGAESTFRGENAVAAVAIVKLHIVFGTNIGYRLTHSRSQLHFVSLSALHFKQVVHGCDHGLGHAEVKHEIRVIEEFQFFIELVTTRLLRWLRALVGVLHLLSGRSARTFMPIPFLGYKPKPRQWWRY